MKLNQEGRRALADFPHVIIKNEMGKVLMVLQRYGVPYLDQHLGRCTWFV